MEEKNIPFNKNELYILKASLNEVCNALDIYDFETRLGETRENVETLLKKINLHISDFYQEKTNTDKLPRLAG